MNLWLFFELRCSCSCIDSIVSYIYHLVTQVPPQPALVFKNSFLVMRKKETEICTKKSVCLGGLMQYSELKVVLIQFISSIYVIERACLQPQLQCPHTRLPV